MHKLSCISPKTVVQAGPIHGRGLFAKAPIAKGGIVCIKGGHIFNRETLREVQKTLGPAEIQIGENLFIGPLAEAEREGSMIFSNHSYDPNIGVQGQIFFVAMRDIHVGEELTHDWATTDDDDYEMECRCGAPNCRQVITGQDWRKKDLQQKSRIICRGICRQKVRRKEFPMARFDRLREIQSLDPERDHVRIQHLSTGYEFPWDTVRALEIALYRTYCVPSISALLDRTGEFRHRTQQRYDDTAILVAEMCEWGYESGRGRQALERMNFIHGHFKISNEDYLYVLSTFVYEPVRWIDKFGWRRLCEQEKLGAYYFWREVGRRMGIKNIPATYEEFERYNRDYERDHFRFAETNQRVGSATRDLFASWFPRLFAPLVRHGIYAMLDERMLAAFGFPRPLPFMPPLARFALKMRGAFVRLLPARKKPRFFTDIPNRTYPDGYEIAELGPPRFRKGGNKHKPA